MPSMNCSVVASVGSTPYMSPERIQSEPYTTLCDIWSAGHTVSGVHAVEPAKTIIARMAEEYRQAKAQAVSDPFPQR